MASRTPAQQRSLAVEQLGLALATAPSAEDSQARIWLAWCRDPSTLKNSWDDLAKAFGKAAGRAQLELGAAGEAISFPAFDEFTKRFDQYFVIGSSRSGREGFIQEVFTSWFGVAGPSSLRPFARWIQSLEERGPEPLARDPSVWDSLRPQPRIVEISGDALTSLVADCPQTATFLIKSLAAAHAAAPHGAAELAADLVRIAPHAAQQGLAHLVGNSWARHGLSEEEVRIKTLSFCAPLLGAGASWMGEPAPPKKSSARRKPAASPGYPEPSSLALHVALEHRWLGVCQAAQESMGADEFWRQTQLWAAPRLDPAISYRATDLSLTLPTLLAKIAHFPPDFALSLASAASSACWDAGRYEEGKSAVEAFEALAPILATLPQERKNPWAIAAFNRPHLTQEPARAEARGAPGPLDVWAMRLMSGQVWRGYGSVKSGLHAMVDMFKEAGFPFPWPDATSLDLTATRMRPEIAACLESWNVSAASWTPAPQSASSPKIRL